MLASLLAGAMALTLFYPPPDGLLGFALGGGLVAAISLRDDLADVRPLLRLLVHLTAAGLLVMGGVSLQTLSLPGWEIVLSPVADNLLSTLVVVWMINLYNFMDGMDGLAGGMAVFGFGGMALLLPGHGWFSGFSALVTAVAGGFLVWNLPPARIFMGDLGSAVLGFLAAAILMRAHQQGWVPIWIGLLMFSPFIFDASLTLIRRLLRGERIWEAHRSHHYQRLVLAGFGSTKVLFAAYGLMAACMISAWLAMRWGTAAQWGLLGSWLLIYTGITLGTERLVRIRAGARA